MNADIVLAAVTAASSLDAAMSAKPYLKPDQFYLDINSVSPGASRTTAKALDGAVRYVDVAVMAPVHPALHRRRCCWPARTPMPCCRCCRRST